MAWIFLFFAGLLEVVWAYTMKLSLGFTKPLPSVLTFVAMAASFALLSVAMKSLPLGYGLYHLDRHRRGRGFFAWHTGAGRACQCHARGRGRAYSDRTCDDENFFVTTISPRNIPLTKKAAVKSGFFVLDAHGHVEIISGAAGAGIGCEGAAKFPALERKYPLRCCDAFTTSPLPLFQT